MEHLVALARCARAGGRPELEELLRASAGVAHAAARARLGESLAADGAAADALARVAGSLHQLRDAQAYPRWLYRIAVRCALTHASARAPFVALSGKERDPGAGPAAAAASAERARTVRAAVATLPRRWREPLYLHFVESLAYREIAAVLGVGLSTVSRRIQRALDRLRTRLEKHDERR